MPSAEGAVLVFDGVCMLCSRSVAFIVERDRARYFRFAPMQSARGRALLLEHGLDPDDPVSLLVLDGEGAWSDSEAVLRVAAAFGGIWALARVARVVPRRWRDAIYRWVARNRYRWFGRRESCLMPTPELRARFLE
jgi:predicted DCC family thiol-disulfide oxidoreductase YuxK